MQPSDLNKAEKIYLYGFPRLKFSSARQCFSGHKVTKIKEGGQLPNSGWLVLWGMTEAPEGLSQELQILRMEDGFLRSVGLGADLIQALSVAIDREGIYFDATRPSELETILQTSEFDEALCTRAALLREKILSMGLTKYNLGGKLWARPEQASRVILVPGQVEADASIAYGLPLEKSNMGLLRDVRKRNPEAYIVYKPHPYVAAKLRAEGTDENEAHQWSDEVVTDSAMGDLLKSVDEVHVITSLAGFEALLRGKHVTCYGQPFYSGWGLTDDRVINPRRTRKLKLDELIAGALIEYPVYLSRDGKSLIEPEHALEELSYWNARTKGAAPWWCRGILGRIIGL